MDGLSTKMASQFPREDILALIDRAHDAAKASGGSDASEILSARQQILLECKRRIASLEDPEAEVWPRAFQINVAVSIDIAATLGVWEKLRGEESITLSEVVNDTGANVAATGQLRVVDTPAGPQPILTSTCCSSDYAAADRSGPAL